MIILVRGLNILILCGFVAVGIMNPLKQIFKKHDVGLAVSEDDNRKITMAIIGYLRSLGYNATISRIERHASLLIFWVKPVEQEEK